MNLILFIVDDGTEPEDKYERGYGFKGNNLHRWGSAHDRILAVFVVADHTLLEYVTVGSGFINVR